MVAQRPLSAAETVLRKRIYATDTTIPVMTTDPFTTDARKVIGEEYVRCTGFGVDSQGQPVMTGCERGVSREDGGSEAQSWPGGTAVAEVGWTAVEIVTAIPTPTAAMVGRQFIYRDAGGNSYTFNVAVYQDGTAYIDWVNEPPADDSALALTLTTVITGLSLPRAVAVDGSGNSYVASADVFAIGLRKYNTGFAQQWSQAIGASVSPWGVATDGTTIYLATSDNTVLRRLCATGAAGSPASFGSPGSGNGQFTDPRGAATNGTHVWVVDSGNNRVQEFTTAGVYVSQFGVPGAGNGQFSLPSGIALDAAGNIYVIDAGNSRVQIFDASGAFQLTFGSAGNGDGQFQFRQTSGIAVASDGTIWVSDSDNNRLQLFDSAGAFLGKIGAFGSGVNELKTPGLLAIDAADIVYVPDTNNGRVNIARIVPPGITPTITVRTNSATLSNGSTANVLASCAAGEVAISGGCDDSTTSTNSEAYASIPEGTSQPSGWRCKARNNSGSGGTLTAYAVCMQVPLT